MHAICFARRRSPRSGGRQAARGSTPLGKCVRYRLALARWYAARREDAGYKICLARSYRAGAETVTIQMEDFAHPYRYTTEERIGFAVLIAIMLVGGFGVVHELGRIFA